jgi:hypothetical protein
MTMATYWVKSGAGGADDGTSWANAAESIPGLMGAQSIVGGDIIYVHNTHNYAPASGITWTLPETGTGFVAVICVDGGDATGASLVDGTVGNITTGAIENTSGNFAFSVNTAGGVNTALFVHGMTFKSGAGGSSATADINISSLAGALYFSSCSFWLDSTSTSALYSFLSGATGLSYNGFKNCNFRFGATGQSMGFISGRAVFENCWINSSGSSPTTMIRSSANEALIICSSCDWSLATNVTVNSGTAHHRVQMSNCVIGTPTTGTHAGYTGGTFEFHACAAVDGSNGADILAYYYEDAHGVVEDSQSVYLTTGGGQGVQDDGTATSYSLMMTPSTLASVYTPLYTPWRAQLVSSTGSKTVAVKIAHTESAVLKDSQVWLEVEYMGEPGASGTTRLANSPHSQLEVDDDCDVMASSIVRDVTSAGTNRTDTAVAWTGITSEKTHTLTATVSCDEVGYIRVRVGLGVDTTNPVYVDPMISVT